LVLAAASLIDPTGEVKQGEPAVPDEALQLSAPQNLQIIQY